MIICSCNRLTDHDVRSVAAANAAVRSAEVYGCLGCSPQCGRCARTIQRIIDEALSGCPAYSSGCPQAATPQP